MATQTESEVLKVFAEALTDIPIRGVENHIRMRIIIAGLKDMASYTTFQSGKYENLFDVKEILEWYNKHPHKKSTSTHKEPEEALKHGYKYPKSEKLQPYGKRDKE